MKNDFFLKYGFKSVYTSSLRITSKRLYTFILTITNYLSVLILRNLKEF